MHGKQQGRQKRARNEQPPQNHPNQQRVDNVQNHVRYVITSGLRAPQMPLKPKRRIGDGPIINRLVGKPDAVEAIGNVDQWILSDQPVFVPKKFAASAWPVN